MSENDYKELLKTKGLKVTKARVLLLNILDKKKDDHLSADDLFEIINKIDSDIGIATVYRNLKALSDADLIEKISLDEGHLRYELSKKIGESKTHHHHHLICTNCRKVISFHEDLLGEIENTIEKETGFHVVDHDLKFYGLCKECQEKQKKEKQIEKTK
ncbi:MAG: transcriptional repressor [Lachnospiraceae bacterium]|jgi:Fur family ferric uptake transcriptional regulator|nr:transcriptional repressor [Lachnospiraceae bacterium]